MNLLIHKNKKLTVYNESTKTQMNQLNSNFLKFSL